MRAIRINKAVSSCFLATLFAAMPIGQGAAGVISYTFKTDIHEVNSATLDSSDYMTIQIGKTVGPIECRSNVLKVAGRHQRQQQIETLAMSALMKQDQVMITIPVSNGDCIDGNPAILDMYVLHNS